MPAKGIEGILDEQRAWASEARGRQAALAATLGVSKQSVNTWLSGRSIPNWATGEKIKAFLKAKRPQAKRQNTKRSPGS
jgi:DNA-binding XRE family transcriptional regulator